MFRKDLIDMLLHYPMSIREIAQAMGQPPRDVEHDLRHLLKSLKHSVYRAVVTAAQCRKCGFSFPEDKLRKPGKCPACRGTWISEPQIQLEDGGERERRSPIRRIGKWGAIFDWDGVIIDSQRQHEQAWRRLAQEVGNPMPADAFARGFGMTNDRIISEILGWTSDAAEIERLSRRKEELYRDVLRKTGIEPLPGAAALLNDLRAAAVPCAIASSTELENISVVLGLLDFGDTFQAIVTADDVKQGKPDPEVFVLAAVRLEVPPQHCIVFEDAVVGIQAALAAGMQVIAVATTNTAEALRAADRVVHRLDELDVEGLVRELSPAAP
ncbi:MAG: hypothetical protein BMS9Abin10_0126 [Gammaproteobacteria bacterium]|nr:MAG: hypothetical protein BMS9Abin10_0126 [Gammaproteobacteria bacterium]